MVSVIGSFLVVLAIVITAIRARSRRNEMLHQERMLAIEKGLPIPPVYKRETPIKWKCSVCGYVHEGKEPPAKCPCCGHPREYFEPANMEF
jgi:rubrerythrin